jgi:phenylalanyl-tRNA synthetase beta chain
MKVPVSWLREYVAFTAPLAEVAERLGTASVEVERVVRRGVVDTDGNLGRFVVGKVVEAGKHPNADRLQLCRVDVGEPEPRQIVCGAWNFGAGATVCVALPGAVLPGGRTLERAELRGKTSDGMILAEDELELGNDHTGIIVLPDGLEPGTPLGDVVPISDDVIELEVTGNRPDLLAVYGLAREVAALFPAELSPPPGTDPPGGTAEPVDVEVEDLEGCPRYIGRLFRDVRIGASPLWLRSRLLASGVRSISNVVDVTNYVMLAFGSPLHAFDCERLAGGRIVVRRAHAGERLVTLDGVERALDPTDLLICDALRPVALAAIMGGLESEVAETTTDVLLEAANFEPVGILRTSERLGLRTEGSNRWEKGVDPYLAENAAVYATELVVELTGARFAGHTDVQGRLPSRPVTRLRPERANALIGLDIDPAGQASILEHLGFDVAEGGDAFTVTVPTWRARDVTREIDLVEEVARIHGLEKVPFTLPRPTAMAGRLTQEQRLRRLVEDVMVGCGFSEAYTWSFVSHDEHPDALQLPEPLSGEQGILRTTLVEGLVGAARHNGDAGNEGIALFEVARVYWPAATPPRKDRSRTGGEQLPDERWHVGGICEGGYARAKGAVETLHAALKVEPAFEKTTEPFLHPGKAARTRSGWVGALHPALLEGSWGMFELDLPTLFASVPERILYEDVITYPAVRQDLAFVVAEGVAAGELVAAAKDAAGPKLREASVFDVYRGGQIPEGKKSVAIRVAFQSPERTLSDDDASELRQRIVTALAERYGAELRA